MTNFDKINTTKALTAALSSVAALLLIVASFFAFQPDASRLTAAAVTPESPKPAPIQSEQVRQEPKVEAIEIPEAKPAPVAEPAPEKGRVIGSGEASYYGPGFAGRPTANGETFNPSELTAAHRSLPFGSRVRVTNLANDKSIVVRINDRGPFVADRLIDVSQGAARQLGMISSGTARVQLEVLS